MFCKDGSFGRCWVMMVGVGLGWQVLGNDGRCWVRMVGDV